ncbi:hypothetical protein DFJ77DRAFT_251344 [Powellomyces hirtus]|nr:hypothetical protein DFJ77DRAFT_251344 [Powellomyces hirtus]
MEVHDPATADPHDPIWGRFRIDRLKNVTLGFLILGVTAAMCNLLFSLRHANKRRTYYNFLLVVCMSTYVVSFIPLIICIPTAIELPNIGRDPSSPNHETWAYVDKMLITWKTFYGLGSLQYIILMQYRFRVVKTILKYKDYWDWVFIVVTFAVYGGTLIAFGTIAPVPMASRDLTQAMGLAIWTMYALVVDNAVSFTFIYQLYKLRRRVGGDSRRWTQVVTVLVLVCIASWFSIISLAMVNIFCRKDAPFIRTFFRITYSFTPLELSGALVFIYNAKALMTSNATSLNKVDVTNAPPNTRETVKTSTDHTDQLQYTMASCSETRELESHQTSLQKLAFAVLPKTGSSLLLPTIDSSPEAHSRQPDHDILRKSTDKRGPKRSPKNPAAYPDEDGNLENPPCAAFSQKTNLGDADEV